MREKVALAKDVSYFSLVNFILPIGCYLNIDNP